MQLLLCTTTNLVQKYHAKSPAQGMTCHNDIHININDGLASSSIYYNPWLNVLRFNGGFGMGYKASNHWWTGLVDWTGGQ
jgi:hypothetical protein